MKRFFFLICFLSNLSSHETVLCIHGFMGAPWNMRSLEKKLERNGFDVINWGYPSRDSFIVDHGKELAVELKRIAEKKPDEPIHFICHSMGSLVLLAAMNQEECPVEAKIGKVVLIAPPLKGSSWGRWLGQFKIARWIAKEFSGRELMTEQNFEERWSYPDSLGEMLVIAGRFGFNPMIKEINDGTLAVSETLPTRAHRHITVRSGHKTILFSKKVHTNILKFLSEK